MDRFIVLCRLGLLIANVVWETEGGGSGRGKRSDNKMAYHLHLNKYIPCLPSFWFLVRPLSVGTHLPLTLGNSISPLVPFLGLRLALSLKSIQADFSSLVSSSLSGLEYLVGTAPCPSMAGSSDLASGTVVSLLLSL